MKKRDAYITVGEIGSTYGIKGWVKVRPFTEFNESILEYSPWYIGSENQWQVLDVEAAKLHGKGVVAKLKGFDTPEQAKILAGKLVAIERAKLPPLPQNQFYWADLIGLSVFNQSGVFLGKVMYLLETGSNDVIVIKDKHEQAIPYLPDVVLEVNLNEQKIIVNWDAL